MSVTGSIMAAGALGGGIIGAVGSNAAANKQANAANQAANLDFQASQNALNFQKSQYNNSLQLLQPYYNTGVGALDLLRTGLGIPGQAPNNFQFPGSAPTNTSQIPNRLQMLQDLRNGDFTGAGPGGIRGPMPMQADGGFVGRINGVSPVNGGTFAFNPGGGPNVAGEGATPGGAMDPNAPNGGFSTQPAMVPTQGASSGGANAQGQPNVGFGSLLESYPGGPFVAPDSVTEQNDPGYKFRLMTGLDQMTNSAAARGGLLSGGTEKAMEDWAQNDASGEYQNVYGRAHDTYNTNFNAFNLNRDAAFNKLAAIAGLGQTSTGQLVNAGENFANSASTNLLGTAGAIGQQLNNAGAARASGITGVTNSITGGVNNLALLSMLLNQQGGGGGGAAAGNGVI